MQTLISAHNSDMSGAPVNSHWLDSDQADYFFKIEQPFTDRAIRQLAGPNVLCVGALLDRHFLQAQGFPQLLTVTDQALPRQQFDLAADSAFLPFPEGSFASVILPHALEGHSLPHQVLREAHRVLQPDGHLIVTCFNPWSCLGLQRLMGRSGVPQGQYYTVARVKDWLSVLGFEVVGSAMYHYSPLSKRVFFHRKLQFLNAVGDRWLPMFGGSFLISARKREVGTRLVGKLKTARNTGFRPVNKRSPGLASNAKSNEANHQTSSKS